MPETIHLNQFQRLSGRFLEHVQQHHLNLSNQGVRKISVLLPQLNNHGVVRMLMDVTFRAHDREEKKKDQKSAKFRKVLKSPKKVSIED